MTDNKLDELILKISTELAVLNTQTKQVLNTLSQHEERLSKIEQKNGRGNNDDYKVELLKLLGKGLVISLLTIGSLTGASSLIKQVFANCSSAAQGGIQSSNTLR